MVATENIFKKKRKLKTSSNSFEIELKYIYLLCLNQDGAISLNSKSLKLADQFTTLVELSHLLKVILTYK